jgi:hypothetical protein
MNSRVTTTTSERGERKLAIGEADIIDLSRCLSQSLTVWFLVKKGEMNF